MNEKDAIVTKPYVKLHQLDTGTYFKFVSERGNPLFSDLMVVLDYNTPVDLYRFACANDLNISWSKVKAFSGDGYNYSLAEVEVYDVNLTYSKAIDYSQF